VAHPWLSRYDAGVPASVAPYPDRTLIDYVRDTARSRPNHPATLFQGARLSYSALDRLSDAFAAALLAAGVARGDRVALLLPNCPQFLVTELGAWKAGAIVCPLNPLYNEQELEEALATTGAETAVVLTLFYERLKHVQPRTALERVIATSIKDFLSPLPRILFTLLKEKKEGHRIRLARGDRWLRDLLAEHARARGSAAVITSDDPATILMSGGTTGTPKGVVGLHRSYVMTGLQLQAWLRDALRSGEDVYMLPLPLSHSFGHIGVQGLALLSGATLALVPNARDIGALLRSIGETRPTFFCGVPTLFNAIVTRRDVREGKVDLRSIRSCFSGAAPLMAETKRRFEELTGGRIVEGYSLTEAQIAVIANPLRGESKSGSIGLPVPDVEVQIVDAETGVGPLAAGAVGEIILRAPQLMAGYWRNPAETALVLRASADGGEWLFTGDLGYLDEDGYVFIVDRKKDLIKTSGYQVWPREIEEVLSAHPGVAEVGVAGVPDAMKGEVVKAWVVKRDGAEVTAAALRSYCRERIAPYKVPAEVTFVAEIPKTPAGKVWRRALKEQERARTSVDTA
jgi:long-chain acyl-CoA synthetase